MAKNCSLCSSTPEVQEQVLKWLEKGKSYRDIEKALAEKLDVSVSSSSIRRHFINCTGGEKDGNHKENTLSFQEVCDAPKPDGADMHNALCHILNEGIKMFFQRMKETGEKTTPYNVHLETYRCLDMLIKMLESLYPNCAKLAEEKLKSQQENEYQNLNFFQQNFLWKIMNLKRPVSLEEFKEYVITALDHATLNVQEEGDKTEAENNESTEKEKGGE